MNSVARKFGFYIGVFRSGS